MPFTAPYKTNFTPGDLIYGLAPSRVPLVVHFGAAIMAWNGPATVDQYRATAMAQLHRTHRTTWRAFMRANEEHPKYQRYMQAIRAHNNDEDAYAPTVRAALQNAAWRAKSKFGMEWTIANARGHIHFVLDAIDMGAVVTKTHRFVDPGGQVLAQDNPRGKAPADGDKERTITHSELRWVYRNRTNPQVQQRVQFWRTPAGAAIAPCGPPWDDAVTQVAMPSGAVVNCRQAWLAYHPTTERNAF